MSMNLTTYVGPYFKVHDLPLLIEDRHQNIVTCGRGQLFFSNRDRVTYLVPNCQLSGVTRQMRFSHDTEMPVIEITADTRADEIESLAIGASAFIVDCNASDIAVERYWGVVCGYF